MNYKYNLEGKTIVNFGDSILGNARPPQDISTYTANLTGATVYNAGFGGCRMGTHVGHWDAFSMYRLADAIATGDWSLQDDALNYSDRPSYAATPLALLESIDFNNVDVITIAYGTNDFTGGNILDDSDDTYSMNVFADALRNSIETISAAYPNIDIVLCTPTYRFWMDSDGKFLEDSDTKVNYYGDKTTDFIQKVNDIASEYGLFVIDNYYGPGINTSNRTEYFPANDGAHHNEAGRQLIAENMAKCLYEFMKNK